MRNNGFGKTLTIFIVLIIILLVSSTAIGFFMYQQENSMRKSLETQLQDSINQAKKIADDLKETKNQVVLLQDKNKEAGKKIDNLLDEMELNNGLHNVLKKENSSLKESLDYVKKEKETIRAELEIASKKLLENQEMLKAEQGKTNELLAKIKDLEVVSAAVAYTPPADTAQKWEREGTASKKMDLEKIIIADQDNGNKGRIISIDKDSEFIICSIGMNQGVNSGDLLSVYRGDRYLGDVRISRAQDQMSAADFIPPLSSRKVRKNDIVVLKQS